MKKILLTVTLLLTVYSFSYSQGFLGKTKEQILLELKKDFSPDKFEDYGSIKKLSGLSGTFTRYHWQSQDKSLVYDTFFNKKGICIVERVYTQNWYLAKEFYNMYSSRNSIYYVYVNDNPKIINSHKFATGKTNVEITTVSPLGLEFYEFWFYKGTYLQDVMNLFATYYEE